MSSKYQTKQTGRPYAEVRGYLRDDLDPAAVDGDGELQPVSVSLACYGTDNASLWRYVGEATVWNYDEELTANAETYCRASLNSDDRFEIFWIGCGPTTLDIPDDPNSD